MDSHTVVHCDPGGREHVRVAGLRGLEALFDAVGLGPDAAERALRDLRAGFSLVLVQIAEIGPADAAARLEESGKAA